jgi:hypothetical protein
MVSVQNKGELVVMRVGSASTFPGYVNVRNAIVGNFIGKVEWSDTSACYSDRSSKNMLTEIFLRRKSLISN